MSRPITYGDGEEGIPSAHLMDCPLDIDAFREDSGVIDPEYESFKHMGDAELRKLHLSGSEKHFNWGRRI